MTIALKITAWVLMPYTMLFKFVVVDTAIAWAEVLGFIEMSND